MSYVIRPATKEELLIMIDWAAAEGWNPGLYDLESFYATDPTGFLMGFLDDQPVSCISAVAYSADFGFIGFYIVKPEHRGQGYGLQIWQAALKKLSTQNIGLDGVIDQQKNYLKSGFLLAYRNIRYEGVGQRTELARHLSASLVPLSQLPFKQVLAYDSSIFPSARKAFLQTWIRQPESFALGFVRNGQLHGYGMVRKCRAGYKVGPLFANSTQIADELFSELLAQVPPDQKLYFDVPEVNKAAVKMAEKLGMKPMFETARMYSKNAPTAPQEKIFGVTSFELG